LVDLVSELIPGAKDLWLLPLGGCGEIGMNMNLYGHDGQWLMVDCGITFAGPGESGPHVQMPDPDFIAARRERLCALLITHAHEDHIGAVAHLWPQLRCPVYATPFAAAILRRKLSEVGLLDQLTLIEVHSGSRQQHGVFDVEWLDLTHSTPQSQGLMIRTPAGAIMHTGDWKLDPDPVVGPDYAKQRLRALGDEGVLGMVCDSTNATTPGHSVSEGDLYENLCEVIAGAQGRVIAACFGSNVARLATLAQVALATGRYAGLLGRSLRNYYAAAREANLWCTDLKLVDSTHLGYLPRREVLAIATGSQGEPRAALTRLAAGNHPDLELEPGDTVVMSSRTIPGNEDAIERLVERIEERGVTVLQDEHMNAPIHASGHPCEEELYQMYQWVSPAIAVPVHGEAMHMQANAEIAGDAGVPGALTGVNGDLFMFAPMRGVRRGVARVGRLGLGQRGLVPLG